MQMRFPCVHRAGGSVQIPQVQEKQLYHQQQMQNQPTQSYSGQSFSASLLQPTISLQPALVNARRHPSSSTRAPHTAHCVKHVDAVKTDAQHSVALSSSKASTGYVSSKHSTAGEGSGDEWCQDVLISNEFLPDPVPYIAPKSKKMALGSITFCADLGRQLGVATKDNSFYLRVEKCDPLFCDQLNFEIERMCGRQMPKNVEDPSEFWPQGALHQYCLFPNKALKLQMDRVYRMWHDQRCGMDQLIPRLNQLKQKLLERGE